MNVDLVQKKENHITQKEIIAKIRELINFKNLEPGDKLPSERMLSDKFDVSRSNVRDAIHKLEFYGILKSIAQSGTFVADIGAIAINGMIDDILRLEEPDFKSLVETRILLELKTVRLAALRRTDEDLEKLQTALSAYTKKVLAGEDAVQEDLLFHLAIAKASGNSTLNTFMLTITPEIIAYFNEFHLCDQGQKIAVIAEHKSIFEAIKNQDTQLAKQMMKDHFRILYDFCYKKG
ncbi:FadR/GntR family transcriptional regulator [Frigoriflavimonas asaccharolytica]|uniref:GntR family transcriptional repressor for pyruvate dehydrogenase complex n=1 Tax=Frigoriflavimonas asaccharolytica TaxID=2735899 RepID=A0A8J8G6Y1_9FLAO|nr:FadR/GntR family transcriptional regulator [Frigoriflavimonas asaccharolytica]NRS92623.1 GntR family transcriptional repressor for pyruvate dehydrogenase complex [Frigoriflavimonas asaccharolytica]